MAIESSRNVEICQKPMFNIFTYLKLLVVHIYLIIYIYISFLNSYTWKKFQIPTIFPEKPMGIVSAMNLGLTTLYSFLY